MNKLKHNAVKQGSNSSSPVSPRLKLMSSRDLAWLCQIETHTFKDGVGEVAIEVNDSNFPGYIWVL